MIAKSFYKDRPAIKLSDHKTEILFLPEDGAKIASFKTKDGRELLAQNPSESYKRLFLNSDYESAECSGFDDMFPTIDHCFLDGIEYLDHGEVCRREYEYVIEKDEVCFKCYLPNLNATFRKTASLNDGELIVKYKIENHNDFQLPYIWAAHMMLMGEEGAVIESGYVGNDDIKIVLGNPPPKDVINIYKLSDIKDEYKYYHTKEKTPVKCGILYPKSKVKISVDFEGKAVKYFGAWVNRGLVNGQYNIAIEPCTALFDSPVNAKKANKESVLKPKETVEFTMKLSYQNIE